MDDGIVGSARTADPADRPRSRRALLFGGLGGLAAVVAQALGRPHGASAGTSVPVYRNESNVTTATTAIARDAATGFATYAELGAAGSAVTGYSYTGAAGVLGWGQTNGGIGVWGKSAESVAVQGEADAAGETSILGVKTTFGHAVVGSIDATSSR